MEKNSFIRAAKIVEAMAATFLIVHGALNLGQRTPPAESGLVSAGVLIAVLLCIGAWSLVTKRSPLQR